MFLDEISLVTSSSSWKGDGRLSIPVAVLGASGLYGKERRFSWIFLVTYKIGLYYIEIRYAHDVCYHIVLLKGSKAFTYLVVSFPFLGD